MAKLQKYTERPAAVNLHLIPQKHAIPRRDQHANNWPSKMLELAASYMAASSTKELARQQLAIQNAGIGSQLYSSQLHEGTGTPTTGNPTSSNLAASSMAASSTKELARQQLAIQFLAIWQPVVWQPDEKPNGHDNHWQLNMSHNLAANYYTCKILNTNVEFHDFCAKSPEAQTCCDLQKFRFQRFILEGFDFKVLTTLQFRVECAREAQMIGKIIVLCSLTTVRQPLV